MIQIRSCWIQSFTPISYLSQHIPRAGRRINDLVQDLSQPALHLLAKLGAVATPARHPAKAGDKDSQLAYDFGPNQPWSLVENTTPGKIKGRGTAQQLSCQDIGARQTIRQEL